MKNTIIIILSLFSLLSCNEPDRTKKEYTFGVIYFNGDHDTIKVVDTGINYFTLKEGDLHQYYRGNAIVSNVRKFSVLSIKEIK